MSKSLNPKYHPPSRDYLANQLIAAWYVIEKNNVTVALQNIRSAEITCDAQTSLS